MWIAILIAATIVADAYMQVHGYKPFMFEWKKDNTEMTDDNDT